MIQKLHLPRSVKLRQIINFMSYVEFDETNTEEWLAIFPNATSNLAFSIGGDKIQFNHTDQATVLSTACSKTVALRRKSKLKWITVQFSPFGMYYFKQAPMHELQNGFMSLDMLLKPSDVERLTDQLNSVDSLSERFQIIEDFLEPRVAVDHIDHRMPEAISMIKSFTSLSIDEISDRVCLSNRRFRKIFSEHVGVSPAFYRKIIRFNKSAFEMLNNDTTSLVSIGNKHGYFDQAHFIKDFKQFSGISPSQFLKNKAGKTDFYNYNLKDLDIFEA